MGAYEKLLKDAEEQLEKFVNKESWSEANIKKGFRDGIVSYNHDVKYDEEWEGNHVFRNTEDAQMYLQEKIDSQEYGVAAYLRSYLNGRMSAETACRLDTLEKLNTLTK